MSRAIVPIGNFDHRLPLAGRLRIGEKRTSKGGKSYPAKLATWRATSEDKAAIEQIAAAYGGTPQRWTDAPSGQQWQVTTQATELRVVLPPDCLGGTPIYELWSGGGCQRRCTGEKPEDNPHACTTTKDGPDGPEPIEVPCICQQQGALACKPMTRLSVVLPDIKFGGVWRIDSQGFNAAQELPGMVGMIQQLQSRGLTRGLLGLQQRTSRGGQRKFAVPVLRIDASMDALASGDAQVRALAPAQPARAALDPGRMEVDPERDAYEDDGVVDGEVVDITPSEPSVECSCPMAGSPPAEHYDDCAAVLHSRARQAAREAEPPVSEAKHRALMAALRGLGIDDAGRHRMLAHYGIASSKDLTSRQASALIDRCKTDPDTVRRAAEAT